MKGRPIPRVAQLSAEYAALLAEKKARYEKYKAVRKEMIDCQATQNNIDKNLGLTLSEQEKEKSKEMQYWHTIPMSEIVSAGEIFLWENERSKEPKPRR